MGGIVGLLAAIAGIILFMLKKCDNPEVKRKKILEKADDVMSQMDAALVKGDAGGILDVWATAHNDIMLKTTAPRRGGN